MSCSAADIAFAKGRLTAVASMADCGLDELVDRWYEGLRHAVLTLHSCLEHQDAAKLLPLLDLLTSLHLGSAEPIVAGVMQPRGGEVQDFEELYPSEFSLILASSIQLRVIVDPDGSAPWRATVHLDDLYHDVGQNSMQTFHVPVVHL